MTNAQNMTIDNFNLLDLCIECINKTSSDKLGAIQIAQGMGLLPNDASEGYTSESFLKQIDERIDTVGRALFGGMVWTMDPEDLDFYFVTKM